MGIFKRISDPAQRMRKCLIRVVKGMYTYKTSSEKEMKAIFSVSGQMKAVASALHLLISTFDKKRRIICPSQHMGTICSLMHIDVGIKANQAGRQASPSPSPHLPFPPCSHLFVPVLKHEYQTCPADKPSNTQQ